MFKAVLIALALTASGPRLDQPLPKPTTQSEPAKQAPASDVHAALRAKMEKVAAAVGEKKHKKIVLESLFFSDDDTIAIATFNEGDGKKQALVLAQQDGDYALVSILTGS